MGILLVSDGNLCLRPGSALKTIRIFIVFEIHECTWFSFPEGSLAIAVFPWSGQAQAKLLIDAAVTGKIEFVVPITRPSRNG
jgi:hypothetical protein